MVVEDPAALGALLSEALGVLGEVKKVRRLYFIERTRVHLDQVEGLGDFLELEVMLDASDSQQQGEATAYSLMGKLGIRQSDLIDRAYLDLLRAGEPGGPGPIFDKPADG